MKLFFALAIVNLALFCNGQKYDYTWLTGYESRGGYDSSSQYHFGISKFDFTQESVPLTYDSLGISFNGADMSMSDKDAHLLFYTNGISVRNSLDEIVENGDSLNNGYYLNHISSWYSLGDPGDMLLQVLPNPLDSNIFDLFYVMVQPDNSSNPYGQRVLRAQLQMDANQGKGRINFKDRNILTGNVSLCLASVRHANGRDWWLCTMQEGTNCYQLMWYSGTDSIYHYSLQCGGFTYHRSETSFLRFSQDGQWLMSGDNEQGRVDFFQFDRCNGTLTLKSDIFLPEVADSLSSYIISGGEYSPNSRYAYLCTNVRLYQFDMQADSIGSTKTLIGIYNPHRGPGPLTYYHAQLGPDGRIYINSGNTTDLLAIINAPDSAGVNCNFQDTSRETPAFIHTLPYYPNYRLGPLYGSSCDSLSGFQTVSNERLLKIFPNPAEDYAIVDYGFTNWNKGAVSLGIINALGQLVYTEQLPVYSGYQRLDVSHFASGIYCVSVKRGGTIIAIAKLVKD